MFFFGDTPFEGKVNEAFYDLLCERENEPTTCWGSTNFDYDPDWHVADTPVGKYLKIEKQQTTHE